MRGKSFNWSITYFSRLSPLFFDTGLGLRVDVLFPGIEFARFQPGLTDEFMPAEN